MREQATTERRNPHATAMRAMREIVTKKLPCGACRRAPATRFTNMGAEGEPHAYCAQCARSAELDRQVVRQKTERAAMRGRR